LRSAFTCHSDFPLPDFLLRKNFGAEAFVSISVIGRAFQILGDFRTRFFPIMSTLEKKRGGSGKQAMDNVKTRYGCAERRGGN
jgi:hypothetical protein